MAHDVGKLRYVMAGLILLTLVLLGWQHWGMNRRLDISPQTGYRYSVTDDRPEGDSIAQFFWRCTRRSP